MTLRFYLNFSLLCCALKITSVKFASLKLLICGNLAITEKTLEINVCGELVQHIRSTGYLKAYVYGFSTRKEVFHGLDISINVPRSSLVLGIQFKAPRRMGTIYMFKIGDRARRGCSSYTSSSRNPCINQHYALLNCAVTISITYNVYPPPAYYAFPLIADMVELEASVPDTLSQTVFVRVVDFPLQTFFDCRPHIVRIDKTTRRVRVYSKEFEIQALSFKDLMTDIEKMLKKS